MSPDIKTLKLTSKPTDFDSTTILELEVRLAATKGKIVEISEVTERNENSLREASDALWNQVLVHRAVNLTHTQAIRRIIMLMVDLELLDTEVTKTRGNSEPDSTEE